jgi:hypothetical protein
MRTTPSGRAFCVIRDPGASVSSLQFNPVLYDVLKRVSEGHMTCTVELHFNDGGLGNTHIRMDGEKLTKALDSGGAPATMLQAG